MLDRDGRAESLRIADSSGSEEFDQAVVAHVKHTWRWQPALCDAPTREQRVVVRIPNFLCLAQPVENTLSPPATEPLPRGEGTSARLSLSVGPNGRVRGAAVMSSSGMAKLDAAAVAHVRQNWRYWPMPEGCLGATSIANIAFPVLTCLSQPLRDTQTAPETEPLPEGQGRWAEMQIAVGLDGKVVHAEIIRSSGLPELDKAGLKHVQANWRWQPFDCTRWEKGRKVEGPALLLTSATIDFPVLVPPSWERDPPSGNP